MCFRNILYNALIEPILVWYNTYIENYTSNKNPNNWTEDHMDHLIF